MRTASAIVAARTPIIRPIDRDSVEHRTIQDASAILRPLLEKTKICLGAGSGRKQEGRRTVIDAYTSVTGHDMLNLSGHILEGRRSNFVLRVHHSSLKPISFTGVPVVLTPNVRPGEERCDRITTPFEVLFKKTENKGEFKAIFSNLSSGNYTVKIGDPNFDIFGNKRRASLA